MPSAYLVDIPLLPESAAGNALQLIDLLRSANLLARLRQGAKAPALAWRFLDGAGKPLAGAPGVFAAYRSHPPGAPAQAVVLASLHVADVPALQQLVARHAPLVRAIGQAVDAGGLVATVGSGAWLAAASGRLQGRQAALPWFYIPAFRRAHPAITLAEDDFCDDGRWASAASPRSLAPLALALVRRAMGERLAQACAKAFEPDAARVRAAAGAAAQVPTTRDSTLSRAIAWMEDHLEQPYSLERVAAAAAVSPRTLLRHFQQEFGHSPLDQLHRLRCERAQVLLEITLESVPSIAAACGYADPTAFRRIFLRYGGATPAAYRARHALRAPRARWRVDPRKLGRP